MFSFRLDLDEGVTPFSRAVEKISKMNLTRVCYLRLLTPADGGIFMTPSPRYGGDFIVERCAKGRVLLLVTENSDEFCSLRSL